MNKIENNKIQQRNTKSGERILKSHRQRMNRRSNKELLRDAFRSLKETLGIPNEDRRLAHIDVLYLAMERISMLRSCLQEVDCKWGKYCECIIRAG